MLLYLKITNLNSFKQLFLKLLMQMLSNFTWRVWSDPRNYKFGLGQESRMAAVTKYRKTSKSTVSPEPLDIIGYKLDWNIKGTLVFKIIKIKKNSRIRSQWPTLCLQVQFCSDVNISRKTWMYFVQIWSQWSLNGTISYLCKLTIQDGRQGLLLKIA